MNAYLIDPATRTISFIESNLELSSIKALIGCQVITTAAGQSNGDLMFVDDNVSDSEHEAFRFEGWDIYSKALVVGTDDEGESTSPKTPIEIFDAKVIWLGPKMFEPNVAFLSWETSNLIWEGIFSN